MQKITETKTPRLKSRRNRSSAGDCFDGTEVELMKLVAKCGILGTWRNYDIQKQFVTNDGAYLNWWSTTGTITFQGKSAAKNKLAKRFRYMTSAKGPEAMQSTAVPFSSHLKLTGAVLCKNDVHVRKPSGL